MSEALNLNQALSVLVGRQLSSIEFVQDYVQLRFDGPTLTAITQPWIEQGGHRWSWNDCGHRDEMCKAIRQKVDVIRCKEDEYIILEFPNGIRIGISLAEKDKRAPEACFFDPDDPEAINWYV